jgi:H+/Cl- antiporter ClcA
MHIRLKRFIAPLGLYLVVGFCHIAQSFSPIFHTNTPHFCRTDAVPVKTAHNTGGRTGRLNRRFNLKTEAAAEDVCELEVGQLDQFRYTSVFLSKAVLVGILTGFSIVLFKSSIAETQVLLYENLADFLPKPSFYWPLAIYPILGGSFVALLTYFVGPKMSNGIDFIAQSIDSNRAESAVIELPTPGDFALSASPAALIRETYSITSAESEASDLIPLNSTSTDIISIPILTPLKDALESKGKTVIQKGKVANKGVFQPEYLFYRLLAAIATLGSGCSLGPEGPAVEIGTGLSRLVCRISGVDASMPYSSYTAGRIARENQHLFLAGTAAGVAGGFNAPITGVFFAIEVGNRYLKKNTIRLDQDAPDGPRSDIAAIVLAAAVSDLIVGIGLHESQALSIQGNSYAMISPVFELSLYLGLGIISGTISVAFNKLRDLFAELYVGETWGKNLPFASLPLHMRPILGGVACGLVSVFFPQTLFVGYVTLDQLLSGGIQFPTPLVLELLALKLTLTSFSICSGLGGGILAPALFFGAAAGTAYHDIVVGLISVFRDAFSGLFSSSFFGPIGGVNANDIIPFFSVAGAPAYATVGAAATLGALFRAPLTSSMLMFELTQNHDIVLPVLVSTGLGGLFAELISQPRKLW